MAGTRFLLLCLVLCSGICAQRPGPGGDPRSCQKGDTSTLPCTVCVCSTEAGRETLCSWEPDTIDPTCASIPDIGVPDYGPCETTDDPPGACLLCLCTTVTDGGTWCNWEFDTYNPNCNTPDVGRPAIGVPCETTDTLQKPPCLICVCTAWPFNGTSCTWEFDTSDSNCSPPGMGSPDLGACEITDVPPFRCIVCLCSTETDGEMTCSWEFDTRHSTCGQPDIGQPNLGSCELADDPPYPCLLCSCLTAADGGNWCSWEIDTNNPNCNSPDIGRPAIGVPCETTDTLQKPPCLICACIAGPFSRTSCTWEVDISDSNCSLPGMGSPDLGSCEITDVPPFRCIVCLCSTVTDGGMTCSWEFDTRYPMCGQPDIGQPNLGSCEVTDEPPLPCFACVCSTAAGGEISCSWGPDTSDPNCVTSIPDFGVSNFGKCNVTDDPPFPCFICLCLSEAGRRSSCYWGPDRSNPICSSPDTESCQTTDLAPLPCLSCTCDITGCSWTSDPYLDNCRDYLPDLSCQPGDMPPDDCAICQCRIATDESKRCQWRPDTSNPKCGPDRPDTDLFPGAPCEDGEATSIPCLSCVCDELEEESGEKLCLWQRVPECLPNGGNRECNEDDTSADECISCQCKDIDGDTICVWKRIAGCFSTGGGSAGGRCNSQSPQPDQTDCIDCVCLNDACQPCEESERCFWFVDGEQCKSETADFICTPRDEAPADCLECTCLNNDCGQCAGQQTCYWYENEQQCEKYEDDAYPCTQRNQVPRGCPNCVCLNKQCDKCVGQQECLWYDELLECEPDVVVVGGITCPGNRPITPCGDIDPCELVGECTTNPDLKCRKVECSRCQAKFYNADGDEMECPAPPASDTSADSQAQTCLVQVPGRAERRIPIGRSFDNPKKPCETCFCGENGKVTCTDSGEDCGKQQKLKLSFNTPNCLDIINNPTKRDSFIDTIVLKLSKELDVPSSFFRDFDLACGSIVVETTIVEKIHGVDETVDVDAKVKILQQQVEDGTLTVVYDGQEVASIRDSFVPIESSDDSSSPLLSEKVVIVIAVAAAVVLLALIVAVTRCYMKSKGKDTEAQTQDVPMQRGPPPAYTNNGYGDVGASSNGNVYPKLP